MFDKFCKCHNTITDPCIVCGKPKFISKDWIKEKAALENDKEISAGLGSLYRQYPAPTE